MKNKILMLLALYSPNLFACEEIVIPRMVQEYISSSQLPFVSTNMSFPTGYGEEGFRCQIQADFNGDGVDDYAAFLHNTEKKKVSPIVFISQKDGFNHQMIFQAYFDPSEIWGRLWVLEQGKHWHWNEQIKLENPGIGLKLFEKPCCRFYWKNGKLNELENDG